MWPLSTINRLLDHVEGVLTMKLPHWKDILVCAVFLGSIVGLLIPSYLLRNDQEWVSRFLGSAGVIVVFFGFKFRVQQAIALGIAVPIIEVIEFGFKSILAGIEFILERLTKQYGRAPAVPIAPIKNGEGDIDGSEDNMARC